MPGEPSTDGGASGVSLLPAFENLSPGFQPTPEGLCDLTGDWWSQEGFASLSTERAARLLPDEDFGAFPQALSSLVGGFPGLEECRAVYAHERVQAAHRAFLEIDVVYGELLDRPSVQRTPRMAELLAEMSAARVAAEDALMLECERVSAWPHWRLVSRLFREWSR
jgi:hypothetical protein